MECINSQQSKKYEAREGAPFKKSDAQLIGESIEKIKDKHDGMFIPDQVVKEAKKKKSPLNPYFTWDINEASHKLWIQEARNIVNHLVEITVISDTPTLQRSFYSIKTKEGSIAYVSQETAIETPEYSQQLLNTIIITLENLTTTMKMFRQALK